MQCVGRHLGIAALVSGAMVVGMASGANATTLTFKGLNTNVDKDTQHYDADVSRATLDCTACEGLLSTQASTDFPKGDTVPDASTAGSFSSSLADLFDLENSSDTTELAFVNLVVDPDFASGVKTDMGGSGTTSFLSDAEYILFKIGKDPNYALIHNLDGEQRFDFSAIAGQGAGLSHIVTFGGTTTTVVPLPASLLLLLSGLGGLGFLGWRKSTAVA